MNSAAAPPSTALTWTQGIWSQPPPECASQSPDDAVGRHRLAPCDDRRPYAGSPVGRTTQREPS